MIPSTARSIRFSSNNSTNSNTTPFLLQCLACAWLLSCRSRTAHGLALPLPQPQLPSPTPSSPPRTRYRWHTMTITTTSTPVTRLHHSKRNDLDRNDTLFNVADKGFPGHDDRDYDRIQKRHPTHGDPLGNAQAFAREQVGAALEQLRQYRFPRMHRKMKPKRVKATSSINGSPENNSMDSNNDEDGSSDQSDAMETWANVLDVPTAFWQNHIFAMAANLTVLPPFPVIPTFVPWNETQYLQLHQRVGLHRALRRSLEIIAVLGSSVLRPLLCRALWPFDGSFWRNHFHQRHGPQHCTNITDAEAIASGSGAHSFWAEKVGPWTNAQRVARGFQQLGPAFVKFGQVLATRPDILQAPLANALAELQDNMQPFDNRMARRIIRRNVLKQQRKYERRQRRRMQQDRRHTNFRKFNDDKRKAYIHNDATRRAFLKSISPKPVKAASIAQVYKAELPGYGPVAIKVQRPGIRSKVEKDATLFHSVARWLESLKYPHASPMYADRAIFQVKLTDIVDEFTTRVFEELDFEREAANIQLFGQLYGLNQGLSPTVRVIVPELIPELCTREIIVMEWIEGTKLTEVSDQTKQNMDTGSMENNTSTSLEEKERKENLALIKKAIECTISQFMDTGIIHPDPHPGNLLKVRTPDGNVELVFLDFGLVTSVPREFRDGIVCAVVQLVFARNVSAVADLCVDLGLLPRHVLDDPPQRLRLVNALQRALDNILIWPTNEAGVVSSVPRIRFENLLSALTELVSRFEFTIPPYFLANARCLATLEGIALQMDPEFNILKIIYPYAIDDLMRNPHVSKRAGETFLAICRSPETRLFDLKRSSRLLNDWAMLTGTRRRKIIWDLATCAGGRRILGTIVSEWFRKRKVRVQREWTRFLSVVNKCLSWSARKRTMTKLGAILEGRLA